MKRGLDLKRLLLFLGPLYCNILDWILDTVTITEWTAGFYRVFLHLSLYTAAKKKTFKYHRRRWFSMIRAEPLCDMFTTARVYLERH